MAYVFVNTFESQSHYFLGNKVDGGKPSEVTDGKVHYNSTS